MSEPSTPTTVLETAARQDQQKSPDEEAYITRQPILDRRGNLFAYELLYQNRTSQSPYAAPHASHRLLDALSVYGLEGFTGGVHAFLRCDPEVLVDNLAADLPASRTVLEIPGTVEPSVRLVKACRALRKCGFRIALDEFRSPDIGHLPLDVVDFIKVHSDVFDSAEWMSLCKHVKGSSAVIIADNVHTDDAYLQARASGVRYFQGYYFCNPEHLKAGTIAVSRIYHVEILKELFKDPLDLKTLTPLVNRDASLVYRVLRLVNSPICAIRYPVTSIESAIMFLGDDSFRRLATLAIQCALSDDQSPELLRMSLLRACFCSRAAAAVALDANEQYLLGMLSLLPAMLHMPMMSIASQLPLRTQIRDALLRAPIKERCLLSWLELFEQNRAAECEIFAGIWSLNEKQLNSCYREALSDAAKTYPER